ncbi:uncharacterized protein LOC131240732 [Magnolia sinica]|uniref:uncharacterized protein LOC131240732 n=1 Tax=Magnolia sinica TaxID=86752 RepID=UPI002659A69C|nr:uncharacterized protein LOC131240732 [Magnolia sinica]
MNVVKQKNLRARPRDIERIHNETFHEWFSDHVEQLRYAKNEQVSEDLRWLARGPNMARRYEGFIVNGFRFHTKDREKKRKTQHSGVVVTAKTSSFASVNDKNPIAGDVTYYAVLTDIIELEYCGDRKVILFKCDWVDVLSQGRGVKKDKFGFTLVNLKRLCHTGQQLFDEPFVFASQVEQVFYVQDPIEKDWHVVVRTKPRDLFEMRGEESTDDVDTNLESSSFNDQSLEESSDDIISWERIDIDGTTIVTPLLPTQKMVEDQTDDTDFSDPDGDDIMYNN